MGLQSMSIATGGTISVAGGSAVAFTMTKNSGNVVESSVTADTDFRLRRKGIFKAVSPVKDASAPNGYTQQKNIALFVKPKLLANGKYTNNTIQLSLFFDPETTAAEKQELLDFASQCAFDSDLTSFMKDGSLA